MSTSENEKKNSSERECITLFKSIFEENRFPDDFDTWLVKEQYNWIKKNIAEFYPNVPVSLLEFITAAFQETDSDRSLTELPEWLDMNKYRRGQKFVNEYYLTIQISKILSIIYLYSFNHVLKAIIIGGRGHTPYLGFTRFLSTMKRIFSWYNGEPWMKGTLAYKNMQFTRRIHVIIRKKLCELDNEKIDVVTKFENPWCPARELLLEDFATACPFENFGQRPYIAIEKSPHRPKAINNADLALVQACFIASVLLYPHDVGLHDATDEDLDAFCHMWRCYGYSLGMKDEYNFCRGDLNEIKQRTRDLMQYWIIPNFKDITPEWEHMTKCFIEPINYYPLSYMPYKVMLLIVTNALDINMPRLYASLSYPEWIAYKGYKFLLQYILKSSILRSKINKSLMDTLEIKISPKQHAELQERSKKQLPDFSIMC